MDNEQLNVKCYICGEQTDEFDNNVIQTTNYTATPMHKLVKTFIGTSVTYVDHSSQLCSVCVNKINEYDLAIVTAKRIENELKEIYLTSIGKYQHNDDNGEFLLDSDQELESKYSVISIINDINADNKDNVDYHVSENLDDEYTPITKVSVSKRRVKERKKIVERFSDISQQEDSDEEYIPIKKLSDKRSRQRRSHNSDANTTVDYAKRKIGRPRKITKPISDNDQDDQKKTVAEEQSGVDSSDSDYFPFDNSDYKFPEQPKRGRPRKDKSTTTYKTVLKNECQNSNSNLPLKCEKCSIKFEKKSEWQAHMKAHQSPNEKLICDVCGQIYKTRSALIIHVTMHKGTSPHECELCGKKFTQKGALIRHMPLHTGERPHQCDKCGKQFIHYSSFHMHQLAHDNIRQKKCSVCGLELRSNSHLTRHMRVHTGEKPFECPTCGQKFAQRYNMTTHLKAHQGIHRVINKTHVCLICNMTFAKPSKLVEHLANQHQSYTSANVQESTSPTSNVFSSSTITTTTETKQLQIDAAGSLTTPLNMKSTISAIAPDDVSVQRFLLDNSKSVVEVKKEMLSETI